MSSHFANDGFLTFKVGLIGPARPRDSAAKMRLMGSGKVESDCAEPMDVESDTIALSLPAQTLAQSSGDEKTNFERLNDIKHSALNAFCSQVGVNGEWRSGDGFVLRGSDCKQWVFEGTAFAAELIQRDRSIKGLLTAEHVVREAGQTYAFIETTADSWVKHREYSGTPYRSYPSHSGKYKANQADYAFFPVADSGDFECVRVHPEELREGEQVRIPVVWNRFVGYEERVNSEGPVKRQRDFDQQVLALLEAEGNRGMSGSPVFSGNDLRVKAVFRGFADRGAAETYLGAIDFQGAYMATKARVIERKITNHIQGETLKDCEAALRLFFVFHLHK